MSDPSIPKHSVLVVDDEACIRETTSMLLAAAGYDTWTARNGFDALLLLRTTHPDVVISDLNMPEMSGFEFLSVLRRRFPEILVIAYSGAYEFGDCVPGALIADAFYSKGQHQPQELLRKIADLIENTAARTESHRQQSAPVWIPRNGHDSNGVPFIVLTCTECLRSFPMSVPREQGQQIQQTPCLFCATPVRYIIDFSGPVASPKPPAMAAAASVPHDGSQDQVKRRFDR